MTNDEKNKLGKLLWSIADTLRGSMDADDFRDYMLAFLFLRYLSGNYEAAAGRELGSDYPVLATDDRRTPLAAWYAANAADVPAFEKQMRRKVHYVVRPEFLWAATAELARVQSEDLLRTLQDGFKYIETESFESTFQGLFSEINLTSEKLGKTYKARNGRLAKVVGEIARGLAQFSANTDSLGDAYEYLIGQFAAGSGKKAGEFYTPQRVSDIVSRIVTLDGQNPAAGPRAHLDQVLDFACGSGSLLLNVRRHAGEHSIGKLVGQEKNVTTYNLARMNMLLHGVKDSEFEIFHGDTLENQWDWLRESNPARMPRFDAVVANPPFTLPLGSERSTARGHALPQSRSGAQVGRRFCLPAAWRAVPWRCRSAYPSQAVGRWPHRYRDRAAGQPVLLHRHSRLHSGAEEVQAAG